MSILEQFKVPHDEAVRVDANLLRAVSAALLQHESVPEADATLAADVLVSADLRGAESHGVSNKLRTYIADLRRGHINPVPHMATLRETPSCLTLDCDRGLGIVVAPRAMHIAMDKAAATGAGHVSVSNGRHLGMAAYHAMQALEQDMIGQCMTACGPRMVPTFAAERAIGTNPIAVAAPSGTEPPFVFDAATTVIAENKVGLAKRVGAPLEGGWISHDGTPLMTAEPVPESYMLLPLGSTRETGSHKGYSLGVVVDILGGLLNGSPAGALATRGKNNHYLSALSVEAFMDVAEFKRGMDDYLGALRKLPPAPGHARVVYAGLQSHEEAARRGTDGIPLHPEVIRWFTDACEEAGIEWPYHG
ncbi:MAG: Ldh family oxidoreductase [Pseudomonadota bacterium]